jgi:hypothetical protein
MRVQLSMTDIVHKPQIVKIISSSVTSVNNVMNMLAFYVQFAFAPGTNSILAHPQRYGPAAHCLLRQSLHASFHIFFPIPVIRIAVFANFHMSDNGHFGRIKYGFIFPVRKHPTVPGNCGEILFLHPSAGLLRVSPTCPMPEVFPDIVLKLIDTIRRMSE